MVQMQRLKPQERPFTPHDGAVGLRQPDGIFALRALELLPIQAGVPEKFIPPQALQLFECFTNFLELRRI